jgi:hypothetical protein
VARAAGAIDVHAHYFPERYLDLIQRAGGAFGAGMAPARPREIVDRQLRLSATDRARILSGNARRLLGL